MEGLDAEKKKNDRSLKQRYNHTMEMGAYTALKDQYSQFRRRMKKGL
jgi:hypothetical protein